MCTVVFLPRSNGPCFASLRDENPHRKRASAPLMQQLHGTNVLAPVDGQAGGTWIGVNDWGNVIILLNGAFKCHERRDTYARSRGVIVSHLLASADVLQQWYALDALDTEPFTLVLWQQGRLYQLVWDEYHKHLQELNPTEPFIWSSATLYDEAASSQRKQWFESWLVNAPAYIDREAMLQFFHSIKDAENGFIMLRGETIQTLSFSFIEFVNAENATFYYDDFLSGTSDSASIQLSPELAQISNAYIL